MSEQIHSKGMASRSRRQTVGATVHAENLCPPVRALHYGVEEATDLLMRLFRGFDGSLALRLWNGHP